MLVTVSRRTLQRVVGPAPGAHHHVLRVQRAGHGAHAAHATAACGQYHLLCTLFSWYIILPDRFIQFLIKLRRTPVYMLEQSVYICYILTTNQMEIDN
jgi:hypothetical protein